MNSEVVRGAELFPAQLAGLHLILDTIRYMDYRQVEIFINFIFTLASAATGTQRNRTVGGANLFICINIIISGSHYCGASMPPWMDLTWRLRLLLWLKVFWQTEH